MVIFDPKKPWKEQKLQVLPPAAGPRSLIWRPTWSPDRPQLAAPVGGARGVVMTYDIASRQYGRCPA